MFALARFAAAARAPPYLASAMRAERMLGPRGYGVAEQSHWMLYALEALHTSLHLAPDQGVSHRDLEEHACKTSRAFWRTLTIVPATNPLRPRSKRGSAGRLAPAPIRRRVGAVAKLRDRILIEVKANLLQQLRYQAEDGGFVNGKDDFSMRIDYIQHNISSPMILR